MKAMSSHLMQASHCQWIFRNFTLHDKQQGYLHLKHRKDLLQELDKLIDTPSDDIPEESRYLLELDYSKLYNASFEQQSYWVLAMKAARRAGRQASASTWHRSRQKRNTPTDNKTRKARYDFTWDDAQMMPKLGIQPLHNRRPRPDANDADNPSNKRLRKSDWHEQGTFITTEYVEVAFSIFYRLGTEGTTICRPRRPCYTLGRAFKKTLCLQSC